MKKLNILLLFFLLMLGVVACQESSDSKTNTTTTKATVDSSAYMEQGMTAIGATFGALSQRLMQKIKTEGAVEAVEYCNLAALPLTDSLAREHGLAIKRTSLQLRNPKNAPTDWEEEVLRNYQALLERGEAIAPQLQQLENGKWALAAAIQIQAPCLKCHGKNLESELAKKLDQFYPKDQARNYETGDLRGIWSIKFNNKNR